MPHSASPLFDPGALAVVIAGTTLACAARCGWRDFGAALREAARLLRPGFDADANRKALARAIATIRRDGSHRANPELPPDRALALMLENYLRHGSLEALHRARRAECALAEARRVAATQVFAWAAELAPVFGLIGTLYAFTGFVPSRGEDAAVMTMAAIATAVLSTLYGALLAHLVCHPLAGAIERHGLARERERAALADWFAEEIAAPAMPPATGQPRLRGVA